MPEKTWQYPSNPENKRKVTEEGDMWRDEKTGQVSALNPEPTLDPNFWTPEPKP